MSNRSIIILIVLSILAIFFVRFFEIQDYDGQYDDFAKCLAEKGFTMYGADWCAACQAEKSLFGSSFQYVPYIECPDNIQLCIDKKVNAYPTWILPDGRRFEGIQGLTNLSQESGCRVRVYGAPR